MSSKTIAFKLFKCLLVGVSFVLLLNVIVNYFINKDVISLSVYRRSKHMIEIGINTSDYHNLANEKYTPSVADNVISIPAFAFPTTNSSNNNITSTQYLVLPLCSEPVYTKYSPFVPNTTVESLDVIDMELGQLLENGGVYRPKNCRPQSTVAIIVAFRDRYAHLSIFLRNMHPFLMKQNITYRMFIIEQTNGKLFNRAALMNVGFLEAMKLQRFDCFIFHDVDLIPLDNRNLYTCPRQPRHMSVAVDEFNYRLPYHSIFGGVSAMTTEHFRLVNGFSNSYFGWGGEDDDMSNRLIKNNLYLSRYPINIARYIMLKHRKEKANPNRYNLLANTLNKAKTDGLNSIKYEVYKYRSYPTFSWFYVEIKYIESNIKASTAP